MKNFEGGEKFHNQLRQALVGMTLNTASSSDEDLYDLMQYYNENDILNQNEYLLANLRAYVDERFIFMDRKMILKYCEFLKDLGMFFEDRELIERLN